MLSSPAMPLTSRMKHMASEQPGELLELPLLFHDAPSLQPVEPIVKPTANLAEELTRFREFGTGTRHWVTRATVSPGSQIEVATYVNEFWTAMQRQASRLHE